MKHEARSSERVLAVVEDGIEKRTVSLLVGESLALMEQSRGPVTEVAYGTKGHGHKILFAREACARALGVDDRRVEDELASLFGANEATPQLSDVMDRFDVAGERYAYMAWSEGKDAVYRPERALVC